MDIKIIKSKRPKCITCNKKMKEWDPFVTEHEHIECASKRIANEILSNINNDLKK